MRRGKEYTATAKNGSRRSKRELVTISLRNMLGHLSVGQKIPTERELANVLSTSRDTIRTILNDLEKDHIIKKVQGSGTFLVRPLAEDDKNSTANVKIGVVLPSIENMHNNPMIKNIASGISKASSKAGFVTKIRDIGWEVKAEMDCLYELSEETLQGLIIYPFHTIVYEQEFLDFIAKQVKRGLPIVLLDRYLPQVDTCYVIPDYYQAAYTATRHLIMLGHRLILNLSMAKVGGSTGVISLRGYKQALQDYSIPYREELVREREDNVSDPVGNAYNILKEYLANGVTLPFTAIVSDMEGYVYGAYKALKEHGVKIPDDIAIVSEDMCSDPAYDAEWTYITYPWEKMGRKAIESIELKLSGLARKDDSNHHMILSPELKINKSCGMYLGTAKKKSAGTTRIVATYVPMRKQLDREKAMETGT